MWSRVMLWKVISCGCLSSKIRWRVALIAYVAQNHGDRGLSSWIAILATRLNVGSGEGDSPREVNDSVTALCSWVYRAGYDTGVGLRGSNIVQ
jgi:hypothetical protein